MRGTEMKSTKQEKIPEKQHLFDKKKNVVALIVGLFITCALLLASDLLFYSESFEKHAHYQWENWPGFYAVFGFVSCVLLVLVSKYLLRPLVKRSEDYYDGN